LARRVRLRDLKVDGVDWLSVPHRENSLHPEVYELSPKTPMTPQGSPGHNSTGDGADVAYCSRTAACTTDPGTWGYEVFPITDGVAGEDVSMIDNRSTMSRSPNTQVTVHDVASPMRIRRATVGSRASTESKELESISEAIDRKRSNSLPDPASVKFTLGQLSPWWTEANQLSEKLLRQREKWDQYIITGEGSPSKSRTSAKHGDLPTPSRRRDSSEVGLLKSDDELSNRGSQCECSFNSEMP